MTVRTFLAAIVGCVLSLPVAAIEAPLPRHPAPSPDGTLIAFSWQGDLWLVDAGGGAARRLTAHPATERFPVWSRDGRFIAFASDRHGNDDVFIIPTDGSRAPQRLTFASTTDIPEAFTPDGTAVLFSSGRARGVRWGSQLWTVALSGGTPAMAQAAFVTSDGISGHAAYSPDGGALIFVRGSTKWVRRGYRGPASRDLWLRGPEEAYTQLTTWDGPDDSPSWVDDSTIAFLSDREGTKNVYLLDRQNGRVSRLTDHQGSAVRCPRASADGSIIAYEFEDAVWTVSPQSGASQRVHIEVPAEKVVNPVQRQTATDHAQDLAISADGKLAAFIVHGDVFVTDVVSKEDQEIATPPTVQVTATPESEANVSWSPDGTTLLFSSASGDDVDVCTARRADEEMPWTENFDFVVEHLTDSPAVEQLPRFSPDGERVAFVRGKGELVVMPAAGGEETVLLDQWATPEYEWSPDGAWIAYSIPDESFNSEVWIVSSSGGSPYNVSRHPDEDVSPSWSPDGRRLVWLSRRHDDTFDVWGVWLTRADDERTAAQWLKVWKEQDEPKKKGDGDEKAEDAKSEAEEKKTTDLPTVTIDFDDLWRRVAAITDLKGDEGFVGVSPDGKTVVFTAEHEGELDLYSVRWDGEDIKRLTEGGAEPEDVQFGPKGATLFYLDDKGKIKRVGLDAKSGDPIPFSARYEVDAQSERAAVFDAAWLALEENFYDPNFHGVDWPAQREKYRPWALEASTDADFSDVVNLMLGELNASHMGYYPRGDGGGDSTGWLGVTFDPTAGGPGLLIREVLPDSPAARTDVGLHPGERLLAVNGTEITETTNVFGLFVDTVDRPTPITVQPSDGVERTVVVAPVDFRELRRLRYQEWVRERRHITDELSGNRLGYLHIQGMDIPSFEEFERDLYAAAHGKDGLLIDVRSNGGGWTTDYLMAVLMVQRHAYTVPRDADPDIRAYPQGRLPLAAWTRPAAALCNEDSYSNAEIFSHAFKSLDRGPLVGWPTFGAVISTGGTRLLNGAWVRLPFRGWFVAPTGVNMELNGAVPDVLVAHPPAEDSSAVNDTQLARAVEVLLADLETDPRTGAW